MRFEQLDNLFACSPSVLGTDGHVRILPAEDRDAQAARQLCTAYALGKPQNPKTVATKYGANEQRVADMYVTGFLAFNEVRRYFPTPQGDRIVEFMGGDVTGTIDVLSPVGEQDATFAHWFPDDRSAGYANRMFGMAAAIRGRMGWLNEGTISGLCVFLRNRTYTVKNYSAKEIRLWHESLLARMKDTSYRPSRVCGRCPIYSTCEARHKITEGVLKSLPNPTDNESVRLVKGINADTKQEPQVVAALEKMLFWAHAYGVQKAWIGDVIRSAVERVGPIKLSSGYSLALRGYPREVVDGAKAWKVLRKHLPDPEILDAARLSLPKLMAAKAAGYNRGEKEEAVKKMENELREAGAVRVVTDDRLEEVDLEKEQSDEPSSSDLRVG